MTNDLVKVENRPMVKEDDSITSLTKTGDYLPQLRVFGSENEIVKEGKFPMGHFGCYFTSSNISDLDTQTDCLILGFRPRASMFGGDNPISYYGRVIDGEWAYSNNFEEAKNKAMAKSPGFLVGLEFLIWLPTIKVFALLFMGNATLRRESPNVKALMDKAATLKIKLIKNKKGQSWHGFETSECKVPFDLPDQEAVSEQIAKFYQPVDSDVELVESDEKRAR